MITDICLGVALPRELGVLRAKGLEKISALEMDQRTRMHHLDSGVAVC